MDDSPSIAPFVPSPEQSRFLALHARHFVTKWVWIFGGGTLRATTDEGKGATISGLALAELVDAGLCEADVYGVKVTQLGKEMACAM